MAYIVNKSDGTVFVIVQDSQIASSSGITVVGKNYAGYGEVINENFVHLAENFASSTAPTSPLVGQLWYDTANDKLKLYNNSLTWTLPQGASGPIGYTGSTGNVGYTGSEGPTGPIGGLGYTGSEGAGFTGSAGIQGNVGYTGSAGIAGNIGYTGSAGSLPTDAIGQLTNDGAGLLTWEPLLKYITITASIPASSVGQVGDVGGMIALDSDYIYYCTQNYDGVTDVWKRVAWSTDVW